MIPEAAVEAAVAAMFASGHCGDNTPRILDAREEITRAALEAAAPHMLAEAWDTAYDDGFTDRNYGAGRRANPHRPTP